MTPLKRAMPSRELELTWFRRTTWLGPFSMLIPWALLRCTMLSVNVLRAAV